MYRLEYRQKVRDSDERLLVESTGCREMDTIDRPKEGDISIVEEKKRVRSGKHTPQIIHS